jgi:hypothetical protein
MILYQYPPQPAATISTGPIEFVLDGIDTPVTQDTATPANNKPLPSSLFISKEGVMRPVADSATPANVVAVPVKIMAVDGTNINITAGDINVQTTDMGASFDSMRVGDGSGNYIGVTALGEAKTKDASTITALGLLAKLTDTQPVSLATAPLATGAATSANQASTNTKLDTLIDKDYSTSSKQDLLFAELQLKADLTETQPVAPNITRGSGVIDANTTRVALATDGPLIAAVGTPADAVATTDTGSFSILAFIKRGLQNWTTLLSRIPATLGQNTMANSLAVTIASDQSAFPTTQGALTGSFQEILNLTTTDQTFTAPASAKWCKIYADDTNVANIRVKIGGTATITSGIQMQPGRGEDFSIAGNISVIAESATNQKINVHFGV